MNTSPTTEQIAPAWVAALQGVHDVTEDSTGHHGNKYASLGACLNAVKPVLAEHGLALQQYNVPADGGRVRIRTRIWHTSGEWLEDEGLEMPAPNDPQKVGGAVTYGRRYSLTTFFGISTADDDGQAASDAVRNEHTSAARPAQSHTAPSAATTVFNALRNAAGTPAANAVKAWADAQERSLAERALAADEEWCAAVADKLADELEAGLVDVPVSG